jgi:hypothetical protein
MKEICLYLLSAACVAVMGSAMPSYAGEDDMWTITYKGEIEGRPEHTVTHAADVLSRYMGRVLGTEIKTAPWEKAEGDNLFLIMDASRAPEEIARELDGKRGDAFLIQYPYRVDGKKVCLLVSHDSHGYDYPVYHFLRRFMGVDWVGPGETGEVVPSDPDWRMPREIYALENPDFEMRHWGDSLYQNARPLLAGSPRMGFHHAVGYIFSPAKYGESDPDVYPLIEGKRYIPDWKKPGYVETQGWQPCVGNPRSVEIATKHVLDQFANEPSTVSVSLSVNDGDSNHCMCDLCCAMDARDAFKDPLNPNRSDRYFRFYNTVMERVLEIEPSAYVAVLGYGPTGVLPLETKIHDRICVFISTGANPRQYAAAGGSSALYHYHLDNAFPTIRHYPHTIARYLRESKKVGGMGYYAQIEHNWAAGGPKTYVLAQLLWDVNSDVDALLDRYMRLAFGEQAAEPMRAYFDWWEEVWQREADELPNPYDTIYRWNGDHIRKFRYLKWGDVEAFDAALDAAGQASMTEQEKTRFDYFSTYYQWIRCSMVQYLMAQDIRDPEWVASKSPDEVLATIGECQALTAQFDKIWDESISKDRTGWLLNQKHGLVAAVERGERFYDSLCVEPIRAEIEADIGKGTGLALQEMSGNVAGGKTKAVAFWEKELEKRPELRPFIRPEIDRIQGIKHRNLVSNGDFEKGTPGTLEPGNPPHLPGWWFYDRVGMVLGSRATYDWNNKEGRNGGYAIGCGPGQYPGLRTFVQAESGRYRFSFWYRTVNRKDSVDVSVFQLGEEVRVEELTSPESVRAIENDLYLKFLRRSWEPTGGEWKYISQTFTLENPCGLSIPLEPFYMEEDAWVWFDDVEVVKLY